jgi:hypothetical protein
MALIKVDVEVSKEAHELAQALKGLVESVKKASEGGFKPIQDLPIILAGNLSAIMSGVEGMDKLTEELATTPSAFAKAWGLAGADIAALFIKKA